MRDAITCRIKFFVWLLLFIAPVLMAIWGQKLDQEIVDNAYLPASDPQLALAQAD